MMIFKRFIQHLVGPPVEGDHIKRLAALEERWQSIEAEWTDWYEKFRLLHLRIAHRQKALEKQEAAAGSVQSDTTNGEEHSSEPLPSMFSGLNDAQKEMQKKILRQRARM